MLNLRNNGVDKRPKESGRDIIHVGAVRRPRPTAEVLVLSPGVSPMYFVSGLCYSHLLGGTRFFLARIAASLAF